MINTSSINSSMMLKGRNPFSESEILASRLEQVDDKQGIFGNIWNGIKEITTLGVSMSDCESMLEKYNKGEVSFDEALEYINEFDSKQASGTGLLENILTGIGAIAMAGAGPVGWGLAFIKGAPIGSAIKSALGILDRATNDIEGDALDGKQVIKDAVSGALTGAASAVSGSQCYIYKGLENASLLPASNLATQTIKGGLCGVECGLMSGTASYMMDVAFGDREFSFGDLTSNALTSAFVSGTVGGAVGAGTLGLETSGIINSNASVAKYSVLSSARKALGTGEREILDV